MSLSLRTDHTGDRWALVGRPAGQAGVLWARLGAGLEVALDALEPSRVVMIRNVEGSDARWQAAAGALGALLGTEALDALRLGSTDQLAVDESTEPLRRSCARLAMASALTVEHPQTPLWILDEFEATHAIQSQTRALGFEQHLEHLADIAATVLVLLSEMTDAGEAVRELSEHEVTIAEALLAYLGDQHPDHQKLFDLAFDAAFPEMDIMEKAVVTVAGEGPEPGHQLIDTSDLPALFLPDTELVWQAGEHDLRVSIDTGRIRSASKARRLWVRVTASDGVPVGEPQRLTPDGQSLAVKLDLADSTFDPDSHWIEVVANPTRLGLPRDHHLLALAHREARLAMADERVPNGLGLGVDAAQRWTRAHRYLADAGFPEAVPTPDYEEMTPFITEQATAHDRPVTIGALERKLAPA